MAVVPESESVLMSIGEVLVRLREEFRDVSISKIRFLESHGLVHPARTPSGYRKFSIVDLERLRYILRMQRDQFLPLRVIREHLEAIDRGENVPMPSKAPRAMESTDALERMAKSTSIALSRDELVSASGATMGTIVSLIEFGLLPSDAPYDAISLGIATQAATLHAFGLEPRHLKTVLQGATREVDLFAPIIKSARSGKHAASSAQAEELTLQIAGSLVALHELLVRALIEQQR